ncbi:hypothetical protein VTN96DRAFT_9867 [Rasamsonia emersonii]
MPRGRSTSPDPANQERGYKAAIHNPRVSEPAKQRARQVLADQYGEKDIDSTEYGGRRSARRSPSAGSRASSRSRSSSAEREPVQSSRGEMKNRTNVVRGLKAAVHNPNNTDMGKRSAQEKLESLGESAE